MGKNTLRVAILNAILLMGGALAYPEAAYAQGQVQTYSIAAGDLESVLSRFGTESRIQLIYPPELLKGKRSNGLMGSHTPTEALRLLLEGSGLEAERVNDKTVVIKRSAVPAAEPRAATRKAQAATQSDEPEVKELDTMTVTGTRIRGGTSPSPTIVMDEVQFKQEGFTDLGEVIRSIPQNFRGGQNPGIASGASLGGVANANATGGSALNLRGLGPDATLTLLNGRRLSNDGNYQAVDISAIPIEAVERVEIVPDGASAIYGSDAVGGVANVVLKRDFEGVTLGTQYGDSDDGGLTRHTYTATGGAVWNSGGLIATYIKSDQDPLFADQRSYAKVMDDPTTLFPGTTLRSGLLSAHQSIGDIVDLRLDALRTERTQDVYFAVSGLSYFQKTETTTTLIAPSLQVMLPHDWSLTVAASRGKSDSFYDSFIVNDGNSTLNSHGSIYNESQTWEVGSEGPLFSVGQHDARLAIGAGSRSSDYRVPDTDGNERSRYAYAEFSLPIISASNARSGVRRLEFSAAVRSEDYDSFGGVVTPKLGVIYDPSLDFTFKASWGRSFKAPSLLQRYYTRFAYLLNAKQYGCADCASDATLLMSNGGNPDLNPERARTWTTSIAFHPSAIPALEAELTYFAINYTQRVAQPITVLSQALSNPVYAPFVHYEPTIEEQQQLIAAYSDGFYNYAGAAYDPSNVVAIVANQYTNVTQQQVHGLDLTGSYHISLASGDLALRGAVSWIDLTRQNSPGQPENDLSGMIFQPAELNGRVGTVWSQGGLSLSAFANYTSGVTSTLTAKSEKTASFTTFDSTLRYETDPGNTALSGLTFALSVNNLFNRAPPLFTPPAPVGRYAPYDSTNYSAIGRYVTVSVSKHW